MIIQCWEETFICAITYLNAKGGSVNPQWNTEKAYAFNTFI